MANTFDGPPDYRQSDREDYPVSRFRPRYRALSDEEKSMHDAIKLAAEELEKIMVKSNDLRGNPRYHALAITSLEQAVMWAVKGLTS